MPALSVNLRGAVSPVGRLSGGEDAPARYLEASFRESLRVLRFSVARQMPEKVVQIFKDSTHKEKHVGLRSIIRMMVAAAFHGAPLDALLGPARALERFARMLTTVRPKCLRAAVKYESSIEGTSNGLTLEATLSGSKADLDAAIEGMEQEIAASTETLNALLAARRALS